MRNVLVYRARERAASVAPDGEAGGDVVDLEALRARARVRAPLLMQDVTTLAAMSVDRPEVLMGMLEAGQRIRARVRDR